MRGWTYILLLIFIVPTLFFNALKRYRRSDLAKGLKIEYLIQTGTRKTALPQIYLEELMGLSRDKAFYYNQFNEKLAKSSLLNSHIIHYAEVKKHKPNAVYIDYEVREPIATIGEFDGVGIDEARVVFPMDAFLSPRNLPALILGFNELPKYGERLEHKNLDIALNLLQEMQRIQRPLDLLVKKIDLRNREHVSYAKCEIIVVVEKAKNHSIHFLRLDPLHYRKNIENYLSLSQEELTEDDIVIDFRIDRLAFIESIREY